MGRLGEGDRLAEASCVRHTLDAMDDDIPVIVQMTVECAKGGHVEDERYEWACPAGVGKFSARDGSVLYGVAFRPSFAHPRHGALMSHPRTHHETLRALLDVLLAVQFSLSDSLSPASRRVFVALAIAPSQSVSEIARTANVSDSVASRSVTALMSHKLVSSARNRTERRCRTVRLTQRGERAARKLAAQALAALHAA